MRKCVLFIFTDSLFEVNQFVTFISSTLSRLVNSSIFDPEIKIFVSSANKINFKTEDEYIKSLMNTKNNRGPRVDPWGTPWVMGARVETQSFTWVNC